MTSVLILNEISVFFYPKSGLMNPTKGSFCFLPHFVEGPLGFFQCHDDEDNA
jgi:hypothetical protein